MAVKLKPVSEQVIVITGASSGIGLATARMAARQGAKLVLAARSTNALDALAAEIEAGGGQALAVPTDVAKEEDVEALAKAAVDRFGGFDTWVNNAGTGIYGRPEEIPVDEMRRLFDVNLWGLVYGSRAALKHLRRRGGALINVGSTESHRAVALQGVYSASKHAVKAFTDEFRVFVEADGAPVVVTLVKPGAIDTPFPLNAKNYLDSEPQHVPPVYAAGTVAEAILHCAAVPTRDLFVGSGGKMIEAMEHYAPSLADTVMLRNVIPDTPSGRPPRRARDDSGLERPSENLAEGGNYPGHVQQVSLYTRATEHPLVTTAVVAGVGLALATVASLGARKPGR